jgi:hypothetical protein
MAQNTEKKNHKIADQILEAVHDTRYSPGKVARYLVEGAPTPHAHFQILQTLSMYCELLAIRYDYGDFNAEEYPWVKQAAEIRDLIQNQSVGSA